MVSSACQSVRQKFSIRNVWFLREIVLGDGDFKDSVKEQPGSSSVVQGIAGDRYGVGYSGIGYKTADVRALPLSSELQGSLLNPLQRMFSGDYPLFDFCTYINHKPERN